MYECMDGYLGYLSLKITMYGYVQHEMMTSSALVTKGGESLTLRTFKEECFNIITVMAVKTKDKRLYIKRKLGRINNTFIK